MLLNASAAASSKEIKQVSRSTIYSLDHRWSVSTPFEARPRSVDWLKDEIEAWVHARNRNLAQVKVKFGLTSVLVHLQNRPRLVDKDQRRRFTKPPSSSTFARIASENLTQRNERGNRIHCEYALLFHERREFLEKMEAPSGFEPEMEVLQTGPDCSSILLIRLASWSALLLHFPWCSGAVVPKWFPRSEVGPFNLLLDFASPRNTGSDAGPCHMSPPLASLGCSGVSGSQARYMFSFDAQMRRGAIPLSASGRQSRLRDRSRWSCLVLPSASKAFELR